MRLAPPDAKYIRIQGKQAAICAQQSMLNWPGLKLLGCACKPRKGINNSILYTIQYCEEEINLVELLATFSYDAMKEYARFVHARTYASAQCTEFCESLRLHETTHTKFTIKHLFVELIRAKSKRLVCIT